MDVLDSLTKPSVLSWLLLREMYGAEVEEPDWKFLNSGNPSTDFQIPNNFVKWMKEPPIFIFKRKIKKLENTYGAKFHEQWAFEF